MTSPALHLCIVSTQVKSMKRWGDDSSAVPSHRNFQYLDWFALVQLPKGRESPSHAAKDSHSWRRYGSPSAGRPLLLRRCPSSAASVHARSPRNFRDRPGTRRAPHVRPGYRRSAAVVPHSALVRGSRRSSLTVTLDHAAALPRQPYIIDRVKLTKLTRWLQRPDTFSGTIYRVTGNAGGL